MKAQKIVEKEFKFPFEFHKFQEKSVSDAVRKDCVLLRHSVGLGKSAIGLSVALWCSIEEDVEQIWIVAPPILADQWYEFVKEVQGIDSVVIYRGTPEERLAMPLNESVIIMSTNIFRGRNPKPRKKGEENKKVIKPDKDWPKLKKIGENLKLAIIFDELSLKSLSSRTYRKLKKFLYGKMRLNLNDPCRHKLIALNATPISDPSQSYNWSALMTPGVYGSKRLFDIVHVEKQDHWGHVEEWKNQDLMKENLDLFSVEAPKGVIDLPEIVYNVVPYQLSSKHGELYREVAKAQFDALPPDKIELAVNSMFSTLQRLILVPDEFGLKVRPPILDYIDGYLDQIGDEQVIIFTRHVLVSKMLHEYLNNKPDRLFGNKAVAIYGGVNKKTRDEAFRKLKSGEAKQLVANIDSVGHGLNLQFMYRILFAELPFRSDRFEQTVGRVHRQGQRKTCFVDIPVVKDSIQEHIYHKLLKNDEDMSMIFKDKKKLSEFLDL